MNTEESKYRLNKFMGLTVREIALILLDNIHELKSDAVGDLFTKCDESKTVNQVWLFKQVTGILSSECFQEGGTGVMNHTMDHLESDGTIILENEYVKNWYKSALHVEDDTWEAILEHVIQYLNIVLSR